VAWRDPGRLGLGRADEHGGLDPDDPVPPGEPELKTKLLTSYKAGDRTYEKIHLDGYDQSPLITGKGPSNRKEFFLFTETTLHGVRITDWKFLFKKQDRWFNGVQQTLVTPIITNVKLDPFERFHEARGYDEWQENRSFVLPLAMSAIKTLVESLKEYPPRMNSLDFDVDEVMEALKPKSGQ
jgi:arylsulfatase